MRRNLVFRRRRLHETVTVSLCDGIVGGPNVGLGGHPVLVLARLGTPHEHPEQQTNRREDPKRNSP